NMHRYLYSGGRAWMLGNWIISHDDASWYENLDKWTQGLETWIIEREELPIDQYCEMWLRDEGLTVRDKHYETTYMQWLNYMEERNTKAIGMGFFILGKPEAGDTRPFRQYDRFAASLPLEEELHDYCERIWEHRVLTSMSNQELSLLRLRLTHALEKRLYSPGNGDPFRIVLQQLHAFQEEIPLTTAGAAVLGACDGELSLGDIVSALMTLLDDGQIDMDDIGSLIRRVAGLGMITL
ncbi:MAG: hypothetical protein J6M18_06755, partial [Actinomycetaceae bacterium]|nr:hypothetical protein [Actinomycetaceae bacterium]